MRKRFVLMTVVLLAQPTLAMDRTRPQPPLLKEPKQTTVWDTPDHAGPGLTFGPPSVDATKGNTGAAMQAGKICSRVDRAYLQRNWSPLEVKLQDSICVLFIAGYQMGNLDGHLSRNIYTNRNSPDKFTVTYH